jgi:hypothetical protein
MLTYSDPPTMPHPTRQGWFCHPGPNGSYVGWEGGHGPSINWKHIDGPMLIFSDGQMHWLTLGERLRLACGRTDAAKLEVKLRPNLVAAYQ